MKNTNFKTMLAAIGILGVVPASVTGFTCTSVVPFAKVSLNDAIKNREVDGNIANDVDSVLAEIVKQNTDLVANDVEIISFIKATEISSGSALISAKPNTNYTGTVGITITPLAKIDLTTVITSTQVEGKDANDADAVLKALVVSNPYLESEFVEITDFNAATPVSGGSAKVVAKEDTKYTGEVNITITVIPKLDLAEVIQVKIVEGKDANNEETVLAKVAELNPNLAVDEVEIGNFRSASEIVAGSATIIAKEDTRYTGEVVITINPLPKINLKEVITIKEVDGNTANDIDSVLAEIVNLNPGLQADSVEIRNFTKATSITPGSALIVAKANSKYIGQVGITIKPFEGYALNVRTDEELIVKAINLFTFNKSVKLGSSADNVVASINSKFIKDRLPDQFANIFKDDLFSVNAVLNGNSTLLDNRDLAFNGLIQAKVAYNYGTFRNQVAKLPIMVKEITRSEQRDTLLKQIRDKANKNQEDNEWSQMWFNYFRTIGKDINLFSFEFPEQDLDQPNILKNIIYDEMKLVMESDLNYWGVAKGYDPTSVEVKYNNFQVDTTKKQVTAKGRAAIDIRVYGSFVKHSVPFNYVFNYVQI